MQLETILALAVVGAAAFIAWRIGTRRGRAFEKDLRTLGSALDEQSRALKALAAEVDAEAEADNRLFEQIIRDLDADARESIAVSQESAEVVSLANRQLESIEDRLDDPPNFDLSWLPLMALEPRSPTRVSGYSIISADYPVADLETAFIPSAKSPDLAWITKMGGRRARGISHFWASHLHRTYAGKPTSYVDLVCDWVEKHEPSNAEASFVDGSSLLDVSG